MTRTGFIYTALAAVPLTLGPALAQDVGKEEYVQACASCHGDSGLGDGPLAELINVPMPDLTGLAAANDGAFPMLEVIQIIDGRTGVRGHGEPMPIWGDRFKAKAAPEAGDYGAELVVRGRVLALAQYLQSIQK
ncbi:Cytochrome C oxidase, cbb3-type, subunit III [Rhodovulum sp. ES.010]|uniref:c-type cytochrome n=1 Tax=Rhodovulum sp. ES.010 TaxID=1882821 RepID=UPI0009291CFC|nr:c-type cytochrome [Rhodovulum sp. ES.010]SIO54796.1 Cytochrome C oxidase, cbb3-type, subunit III [Rhodovulum sp. ES.010]